MSIWDIWHDKNTEGVALEDLPIHELAYQAHRAHVYTDIELRPIERVATVNLRKFKDRYTEAGRYGVNFLNDYTAVFLTLSNHGSRRYYYRYIGDERGRKKANKMFNVPADDADTLNRLDSKIKCTELFEELLNKEPMLYLCNKIWGMLPGVADNKINKLALDKAQRLYMDIVTRHL